MTDLAREIEDILCDFATFTDNSATIAAFAALVQRKLDEAKADGDAAEDALRRKGYRKSCDIPACNCGDQWSHGGHADERLREIDDALYPRTNGKTILAVVNELVADSELLEKVEKLLHDDAGLRIDTCAGGVLVKRSAPFGLLVYGTVIGSTLREGLRKLVGEES